LDSLVKLGKDKVPKGEKTEVVYQIERMDCDACYIGQTKRHLNTRIRKHQLDIRKKESSWSVVSKHRTHNDHNFDWTNVKIFHCEHKRRKREIAEMVFIRRHNNAINLQMDIENLPCIYDTVLANM
ncbi:hypothetical protein X777_02005, partial [Ooceraea biroi]